jgi:hypothetical protein
VDGQQYGYLTKFEEEKPCFKNRVIRVVVSTEIQMVSLD